MHPPEPCDEDSAGHQKSRELADSEGILPLVAGESGRGRLSLTCEIASL